MKESLGLSKTKGRIKQSGVTLIELVIIIIVMGVVAVPFYNSFLKVSNSLVHNAEITQSGSLGRECAEFILHRRRNDDIASGTPATTTDCDDPIIPGFNAPQETITITSDAAGAGICPVGSNGCDLIEITINDAAATQVRNQLYLYLIY